MAQHVQRLADLPSELSTADFWTLVGRLEHQRLDFKKGAPDLGATFVAMAMTEGGFVILGVTDDRQLVGCPLSQKVHDKIHRASVGVHVDIQLKEIEVDGTVLTVVAIPEIRGRIVTTTDGRLLRRVGSDNRPLVGDALARFVREREERPAEEHPLSIVDPADFDLGLINNALHRAGKRKVTRAGLVGGLVELGVAEPATPLADARILTAAALAFSREPSKYVTGATVQLVRRAGVGPGPGAVRTRREIRGPIPLVLDEVLRFLEDQSQQFHVVVGARREVLPEYPIAVLREAVLNALAHRDYGLSGATIDVTVWDDRIEIQSPGALPSPITLENMRDEHYSRNRRVMGVLKTLGLVEEYGEGVDRMITEMEARLMEPPMFAATEASVTVTLRNRFLIDVEDQVWLSLLGHMALTAAERRALVVARREGAVTPRRLRELDLQADVDAILAGAVAKGLLVRIGERGGARYQLSDEVVMRAGASGLEAQRRKRQMLLDEIRRAGSLSTAEGSTLLHEDKTVVRDLLNDLVRAGLADARGLTRARRYYPT